MVFRCDAGGIFCVVLTHLIVLYADYVVIFHLVLPVLKTSFAAVFNVVLFNTVALLLCFSHLCAVFVDPGIIPRDSYQLTRIDGTTVEVPANWTICNRCSMARPPRAHHCRVCNSCIRRMDHHCPWINNCVGEYNQKYFIMFLVYVGMLCLYAIVLVIVCRAMMSNDSPKSTDGSDPSTVVHTVILIAICCLFGLFVLAIFSDQYKSIVEDETAVESVQNRTRRGETVQEDGLIRRRLSKRVLFQEVFGKGPIYLWLLPCHHLFQPSNCYDAFPPQSTKTIRISLPEQPTQIDQLSESDSS